MKTTIAAILLVLLQAQDLTAFPIPPRPLRQLVLESEYIVVGYVCKTYYTGRTDYYQDYIRFTPQKYAKVAVLERLQGNVKEDTIEIAYDPNWICPAPAMYYPKTFVVAFLYKEYNEYKTWALSYGSKTLTRHEVEIYKMRIGEMQDILREKDKEKQCRETVEWLVKCAENVATRWEGLFELMPGRPLISDYSVVEQVKGHTFILTPAHRARLKKALLATLELSSTDVELVDLVYKGNDKAIERLLLNNLKSMKERDYWYAVDFMYPLAERKSSKRINAIIEELDRVRFENHRSALMKKLIDRFILLYDSL